MTLQCTELVSTHRKTHNIPVYIQIIDTGIIPFFIVVLIYIKFSFVMPWF